MLQPFVRAYNRTVHTTLCMAPAAVTGNHVLEIRTRMNGKRSHVRVGKVKFKVGQHVSISEEKMKFAKGWVQNYTD